MIMKIYAIYDMKAQVYHHPRLYINTPSAIRSLACEHTNPESLLVRYPQDFQFMEIGEWDDQFATIDMHAKPIMVGSLESILPQSKENHENDHRNPEGRISESGSQAGGGIPD